MNSTVTKVVSLKDSAFSSGYRKKIKKKRHRNKYRNSSLKKKRLRKLHSTTKIGPHKSYIFKPSHIGKEIMSNWYWSNYKKALEWQNKHLIAHWKSCALALLEENRYLLQIINNMQPSMIPEMSLTRRNLDLGLKMKKSNMKIKTADINNLPSDQHKETDFDESDDSKDNDGSNIIDESDEIEFEMSEEMMEFFAQSYKQKMDFKKRQEKELQNSTEEEIKQIQNNKIKRSIEMNLLYGDGASMIIGMETAVQLSFDKYCDTKSPKYWPNIPFKL